MSDNKLRGGIDSHPCRTLRGVPLPTRKHRTDEEQTTIAERWLARAERKRQSHRTRQQQASIELWPKGAARLATAKPAERQPQIEVKIGQRYRRHQEAAVPPPQADKPIQAGQCQVCGDSTSHIYQWEKKPICHDCRADWLYRLSVQNYLDGGTPIVTGCVSVQHQVWYRGVNDPNPNRKERSGRPNLHSKGN